MGCEGRGLGRVCAFSDGALIFNLLLSYFFLWHEFESHIGSFWKLPISLIRSPPSFRLMTWNAFFKKKVKKKVISSSPPFLSPLSLSKNRA